MGRYDDSESKLSPAIIAGGLAVILIGALAVWIYSGDKESEDVVSELSLPYSEPEPDAEETVSNAASDEGGWKEEKEVAGPGQESVTIEVERLPPLENSDALVRREVMALSPDFSEQLQTTELVEKYLQVINDFSQGQRLSKHMRFLRPPEPFIAAKDGDGWYIPEKGYRRYDRLAKAFAEIEVARAIRVYQKMRPLLQQAYQEFAYPEQYRLEDLFKKAASEMIAAPVIEGRVALVRPSVRYHFADKQLEALSPVQKQMLRMGPENTRIIQKKLRELVQELVRLQKE